MKKTLRIITIILGLSEFVFADNNRRTKMELINQAELYVIDGDYKTALDIYNSSLNTRDFIFAQDLYNALVCALKIDVPETADRYAMLLANKGVGATFFEKNSNLRKLREHAVWKTLIVEAKKAKTQYAISNKHVNDIVNTLLKAGNKADSIFFASDLSEAKMLRRDVTVDSISEVLLQFIIQNGYPSEDLVPVLINQDTIINALPRFAPIIMKRSVRVNPQTDSLFKVLLMNEGVKKGLLKPEIYLEINRNSLNDDVLYRRFYKFDGCTVYKSKLVPEKKVDYFRISIAACSLNDLLKKVLYNLQFPSNEFSINSFYSKLEPINSIPDFDKGYEKAATVTGCN
jgi:hypothetical protein